MPLPTTSPAFAKMITHIHQAYSKNLQLTNQKTTALVVGITGSVGVGKTILAHQIKKHFELYHPTYCVEVVSSDSFLYKNKKLQNLNIMKKKGFPESYDAPQYFNFLAQISDSNYPIVLPKYNHSTYDITSSHQEISHQPDIIILEGLNILQNLFYAPSTVEHHINLGIYLHASTRNIKRWYLKRAAEQDNKHHPSAKHPSAIYRWKETNLVNLTSHILPSAQNADIVLTKNKSHLYKKLRPNANLRAIDS